MHVELDEEEIFYVLAGTGLSWQSGKTYEVRAGDTIVHRVAEEDHTLIAGPDGLDVLAFGERTNATASYLTRAGVLRMDATVKVAEDRHPWDLEADAGELELPEPEPAAPEHRQSRRPRGRVRRRRGAVLPRRPGSERTGLNWVALPPGEEGAPPHCHSLDEEIFVVLDGSGVLELWPTPGAYRLNPERTRRRSIAYAPATSSRGLRPRGSRTASAPEDETFTYLAYGTRRPNDIVYYPRSNKIYFRGVGIIARLESLDYYDGEPRASSPAAAARRARTSTASATSSSRGELVRRMADAAVEAADEQHARVDAGGGEDAGVVTGAGR